MQKNAFHTLSYGVYAVTAMDGERPVGCIANSAMQITSQPLPSSQPIIRMPPLPPL